MTLVYPFFLNNNGKCFEIPKGNAGMLCEKRKHLQMLVVRVMDSKKADWEWMMGVQGGA